jgi:hypothetical protein
VFAQLLVVAAVVMGISHTIAKERITQPLRERLGGKDTFFGYLVSCPYCASHYVAFVLVPLTGFSLVPVAVHWGFATEILRWFLNSILVVVAAAFLRVGFYFVDETQGLVRRRQGVVEVEKEIATLEAKKESIDLEHRESELH